MLLSNPETASRMLYHVPVEVCMLLTDCLYLYWFDTGSIVSNIFIFYDITQIQKMVTKVS